MATLLSAHHCPIQPTSQSKTVHQEKNRKNKQEQGVREEEIYKKAVHFDLTDYRNNNKGTAQSLNWRDTNEKGRYKLYAEVLCGSEARAKVSHVLNI